jgi:predicted 3-demethylubiquinone-9 3-methyltransferase (glyoxalase superfamily)
MKKITPFLWFNNNAEEAAKFYVSVFKKGKVVNISRYGEGAPAPAGTVMTVDFQLFGQDFIALNGGPMFSFTEATSFLVSCTTQREVDYYWKRLTADGGAPSQCGWLKDKYGLSWQIIPTVLMELMSSKDRAKAGRVVQAMLQMTKIDIKRLKQAAAGQSAAQSRDES